MLWTLIRWSRPAGRGQCIEHIAAPAAGHVLGRHMQQEANGRKQTLLGNNIVLGSLGLKESNLYRSPYCLGKGQEP